MNDDKGIDRTTPAWRIGQVVGSAAALFCAVFGIPLWVNYIGLALQQSAGGTSDPAGIGWMVFGFFIWFIPAGAAVWITVMSFGWKRKVFAKIVTAVGGTMTVVAIVASVIAAV